LVVKPDKPAASGDLAYVMPHEGKILNVAPSPRKSVISPGMPAIAVGDEDQSEFGRSTGGAETACTSEA